ncbi:beta-galactosidase 6-like isoform X2 [Rhodamnia argentea]|nr:beta-galactosidase 6-like isoform X2 [Rhodamnia argentea]
MWLHFIPGIQFRTNNAPFKTEMEIFLGKIVGLMKEESLFATQGGPIILAQVENEYGNVEGAYGVGGPLYVQWAAETAVNMNTSVPWVMCAQSDAPDPLINTCNGFYCDQFTPNSPSKPKMWTENYVGWFLAFGYPIPYRPVEDLAFAVARFYEYGGTFQNYYMYFGGSNFGRTAGGPLVATSYDYDAPLDEYGFIRQPKWGHLRDLHKAIKLCEDHLVSSEPTHVQLGSNLEAHVYNKSSNDCAAFLANYDSSQDATVQFNGNSYFLPAWSVSILPDCKTAIYNTAKVVSQRTVADNSFARTTTARETSIAPASWSWYKEHVGIWGNNSFTSPGLLEQINTTKDTSDFLWYTTSIYVDENGASNEEKEGLLLLVSLGHAALVFINKQVVGFGYGNHDIANFSMTQKINLNPGNNTLDVLSMMIGLQNYGPWFDVQGAGPFSVIVDGLGNGKTDLSSAEWTYQVGTEGEHLGLDRVGMANSSFWTKGELVPVNESLIWYKVMFLAPEGTGPLALNLASMGKGQAWVNGQGVGRYWPAYLSPTTGCTDNCDYRGSYDASKCQKDCGKPAQTLYHVPRSWINPGQNLLVLHEEIGGDPSKVSVLTRTGQEICAVISEADPSPVDSWKSNSELTWNGPQVRLSCEAGWLITSISFASFGNPQGSCGSFAPGGCHSDVVSTVEQVCIGREACSIPVTTNTLGDLCPNVLKSLAVEALCS